MLEQIGSIAQQYINQSTGRLIPTGGDTCRLRNKTFKSKNTMELVRSILHYISQVKQNHPNKIMLTITGKVLLYVKQSNNHQMFAHRNVTTEVLVGFTLERKLVSSKLQIQVASVGKMASHLLTSILLEVKAVNLSVH